MKNVILSICLSAISLLASIHTRAEGTLGLEAYMVEGANSTCERFVLIAWRNVDGIKKFTGMAYINIGLGCASKNHFIFENDSTSPIDFNNIADQELKNLVT